MMNPMRHVLRLLAAFLIITPAFTLAADGAARGVWTDANDAALPADFQVQGEYVGKISGGGKLGCQVIALGGGAFQAVVYPGGLPGSGWDGENKILMDGRGDGDKTVFKPAEGKTRSILPNRRKSFRRPANFLADRPEGLIRASSADGVLSGKTDDGKVVHAEEDRSRESKYAGQRCRPRTRSCYSMAASTDQWTAWPFG